MAKIPPQLQALRPVKPLTVAQMKQLRQPTVPVPGEPAAPTEEELQKLIEAQQQTWEAGKETRAIEQIEALTSRAKEYEQRGQEAAFKGKESKAQYWFDKARGFRSALEFATGDYSLSSLTSYAADITYGEIKKTEYGQFARDFPKAVEGMNVEEYRDYVRSLPSEYRAMAPSVSEFEMATIPLLVEQQTMMEFETQRYQNLGYSQTQASILAQQSLKEGGMSFTPERAEQILAVETRAVVGYDPFGRPQYISVAPEMLTPRERGLRELGMPITAPPEVPTIGPSVRERAIGIGVEAYETVSDIWRGGFGYGLYTTPRAFEREETYERLKPVVSTVALGIGGTAFLGIASAAEVRRMRMSAEEQEKLIENQQKALESSTIKIDNAKKEMRKFDRFINEAGEFVGTKEQWEDYQNAHLKYEETYQGEMKKLDLLGLTTQETEEGIVFSTSAVPTTMAREVALEGTRKEQVLAGVVIFTGKAAEWYVVGKGVIGIGGKISPYIGRITKVPYVGKVVKAEIEVAKLGVGALIGTTVGLELVREYEVAGWPGLGLVGAKYTGMAVGLAVAYDVPQKTIDWLKHRQKWSKKAMAVKKKGKTQKQKQVLEEEEKAAEKDIEVEEEAIRENIRKAYFADRKELIRDTYRKALATGNKGWIKDTERLLKSSLGDKVAKEIIKDVKIQEGIITYEEIYKAPKVTPVPEEKLIYPSYVGMEVPPEKAIGVWAGLGVYERGKPGEFIFGMGMGGAEEELGIFKPPKVEVKPELAVRPEERFKDMGVMGISARLGEPTISVVAERGMIMERERLAISPAVVTGLASGLSSGLASVQASAIAQAQAQAERYKMGLPIGAELIGKPAPPKPIKPFVPIVGFPFWFPGEKRVFKKGEGPGYHTFVKSEGKYRKVSTKPMTRFGAMDTGARIVDNTTSADFKIEPIKIMKVIRGKKKQVMKPFKEEKLQKGDDYYKRFSHKFRDFMVRRGQAIQMKNRWIEKKEMRSDTPGEKQGLTVAQFRARETKRRAGLPVRRTKSKKGVKQFFGM